MPHRLIAHHRVSPTRTLALLAWAAALGCGPTNVGGSGGGTAGTTTGVATTAGSDGADEPHGFTPDPDACAVPMCAAVTAGWEPSGCCEGLQPSGETDGTACPGDSYPNNWTCDEAGRCEHGGCMADTDCPINMECIDPDEVADEVRFCVVGCTVDSDCSKSLALACSGEGEDLQSAPRNYCRQTPYPSP